MSFAKQLALYRLDRMTSGILLIAKTRNYAQELNKEMREQNIHKLYIARVQGKFSHIKYRSSTTTN
jgi:23S rRNA-/tRNA-specific pseudouridylate synthase